MSNIKRIDFKTLSIRIKAKRLSPFVVRYVWAQRRSPSPLNMVMPIESIELRGVVEALDPVSAHWMKVVTRRAVAYLRAGMRIDLCEYAACRDSVDALEALERSRNTKG